MREPNAVAVRAELRVPDGVDDFDHALVGVGAAVRRDGLGGVVGREPASRLDTQ